MSASVANAATTKFGVNRVSGIVVSKNIFGGVEVIAVLNVDDLPMAAISTDKARVVEGPKLHTTIRSRIFARGVHI
jgi:hypothetical protein